MMKQNINRTDDQQMVVKTGCTVLLIAIVFSLYMTSLKSAYAAVSDEACIQEFSPIISRLNVSAMSKALNFRPSDDQCSQALLAEMHLDFTNDVAKHANQILIQDKNPDRAAAWLDQFSDTTLGLPLANSWQVNLVRGEIATVQGNRKEAAAQFEIAYERSLGSGNHMNQPVQAAAPERVQRSLFFRANEARHLYGDLSGAISRSGDPVSATFGTRGMVYQMRMPAPIEFDTNSAVVKQAGLDNIALLVAYINKNAIREFEVIGYTDWRGGDDFNQALSESRAKAVANAIQNRQRAIKGDTLRIKTSGRGRSCPRIVSQLSLYSFDNLAALYRRVSFGWPRDRDSGLSECDNNGIRNETQALNRLGE